MSDTPVASDQVGHKLLRVQVGRLEEIVHLRWQSRARGTTERSLRCQKLCKNALKKDSEQFSAFIPCLLNGFRSQIGQTCSQHCSKNNTLLEATPKMKSCVSIAPVQAGILEEATNVIEQIETLHQYLRKIEAWDVSEGSRGRS